MKGLTPAEVLLKNLGVTEPEEIDLEAIAWTLGIKIRYCPLDSCEARILGNGDNAIITVNSRSLFARQRFSIAHELGHWHHHRGRLLICRSEDIGNSGNKQSPIERDADRYAANLVMPHYLFDPVSRSFANLTFETVRQVAEIFTTSLTATAIRLVERSHFCAFLMCHGVNGRKWFVRSKDVPERWFPRNDLDPESHAFDVLFKEQVKNGRAKTVGAQAWFNRREAERYEVTEETIRTGPDEILSLILLEDEEMLEDR